MLLEIQIPTIETRVPQFEELTESIYKQIKEHKLQDKVSITFCRDNKEMSIGAKRQKMYQESKALFTVQVDDDDRLVEDYCPVMVEHIEKYPSIDAFGYIEDILQDPATGKPTYALHKNDFNDWNKVDDVYHRTLFMKDPIRTEICKQVPVTDRRFGEDHLWANHLKQSVLIKTAYFINRKMYIYRYKYQPHNEKYGIR